MKRIQTDFLIIGSGPAGQKAAIQAAKAGRSVVMVERSLDVGGECVHRGTIPSKTLRETAATLIGFQRRSGEVCDFRLGEDIKMQSLMSRLDHVVTSHSRFIQAQIDRNDIQLIHGRAKFLSPHEVEVQQIRGDGAVVEAEWIIVATGSRPRSPDGIDIDHEHILDSDSILSLGWLPSSLIVIGSGVIASEYASVFASLGVRVTMIDRYAAPLGFIDPELSQMFVEAFRSNGGDFQGNGKLKSLSWDGVSSVVAELEDGRVINAQKALVAQGRVANVEGLNLEAAGLELNARGHLVVDENLATTQKHIYGGGDVIGPPALAASSMEQGRRAVRHALGLELGHPPEMIPSGIYTLPEISMVGLNEKQAIERHGKITVGRAPYSELARSHIAAWTTGLLKLIADEKGEKILGVHILGGGAAELVHIGQVVMQNGGSTQFFIDNIFNFPTMAEAYRVAALDIARQMKAAPSVRKPEVASPV